MNIQTNTEEEERHRKRGNLQREIIMLESDLKKIINGKAVIESEGRNIKRTLDQLRMELQEKQTKQHSLDQDINVRQEYIRRLKKQLNLI